MNKKTLSLIVLVVGLAACKGTKKAPDPVTPVEVSKLGLTIDLAGKTQEIENSDPKRAFVGGDFGGIDLTIVDAAPPIDQVKADALKRLAARSRGAAPATLPNEKVDTLSDGFVLTFGDDKANYFVESYRSIGARVVRCSTEGNPLVRAQGEIAAACKTIKAK